MTGGAGGEQVAGPFSTQRLTLPHVPTVQALPAPRFKKQNQSNKKAPFRAKMASDSDSRGDGVGDFFFSSGWEVWARPLVSTGQDFSLGLVRELV